MEADARVEIEALQAQQASTMRALQQQLEEQLGREREGMKQEGEVRARMTGAEVRALCFR